MVNILVKLKVNNFYALEKLERQAVKVMKQYQGRIISVFETVHNSDGTGEEIHILEFPNIKAFASYQADESLVSLASLRDQAISKTDVKVSVCVKSYS